MRLERIDVVEEAVVTLIARSEIVAPDLPRTIYRPWKDSFRVGRRRKCNERASDDSEPCVRNRLAKTGGATKVVVVAADIASVIDT